MEKIIRIDRMVFRNLNWILFSNFTLAVTQFLLVSFLSKIAGPENVGIYTLGLAITSPVFLLMSLKLRNVVATDQKNEYRFSDYKNLRICTNLMSLLMVGFLLIWLKKDFVAEVVIFLFAVNKSMEMYSDIYHGFFQKKQKMNLIGKSIIVRSVMSFLAFIIVYYLTRSLIWSILANTMVSFLVLLLLDLRNYKPEKEEYKRKVTMAGLQKLFILSLPLGISTAIGSLVVNVPRYFIEWQLGSYSLGVFAGISYLLISGNTFLNAISQVFLPKLSTLAANDEMDEFWRTLIFIMIFGCLLGLTLLGTVLLYGEIILTIIFSAEYAEYSKLLLIMAAGTVFVYTSVFLGTAVTALREFRLQPVMHFVTLLLTIVFSFVLISRAGLLGAAWTVSLSYAASSVGYGILLWIAIKKRRVKRASIQAGKVY